MGQFIDMTGQIYGDLTVIERDNNKKVNVFIGYVSVLVEKLFQLEEHH